MAKQKKTAEEKIEQVKDDNVDSFIAEIEKSYGEGIVNSAKTLIEKKKQIISLSPCLDMALGGGIPEGSTVIISGAPKCGKGVTSLTFAAECQKEINGSRKVCFLNAEHRLKRRDLVGIKGLKTEEPFFYFVESTSGKILNSEDFLNIGTNFLKQVPGGVLIIDSVSCLVPTKILTDGIGTSTRGAGNVTLGQFWDINGPVVNANNNIVIGISQVYANTSGYGANIVEKISNRWRHQADVWLQCKSFKGLEEGGEQIGQEVEWLIKSSALGGPGKKVTSYLRYGKGVDKTYEICTIGEQLGLLLKGGAGYYSLDFLDKDDLIGTEYEEKDKVKIQGIGNLIKELESNENWLNKLNSKINQFLIGE